MQPIIITLKDPDCLYEVIDEAVADCDDLPADDDEREAIVEMRTKKLRKDLTKRWFEYGEYLRVEYDPEAHTLRVMGNDE